MIRDYQRNDRFYLSLYTNLIDFDVMQRISSFVMLRCGVWIQPMLKVDVRQVRADIQER